MPPPSPNRKYYHKTHTHTQPTSPHSVYVICWNTHTRHCDDDDMFVVVVVFVYPADVVVVVVVVVCWKIIKKKRIKLKYIYIYLPTYI